MTSSEQMGSERLSELPFETAEYLAVRTWAANPERYAERLARFFIERPRRLELGYGVVGGGVGDSAVAREAIGQVVPHLNAALLRELEACCIGFAAEDERDFPSEHGRSELLLLSAFGNGLSQRGHERLKELRERFPHQSTEPPDDFAFRAVESPIPQQQAAGLSDEEWLKAMPEYPFGWDDPGSRGRDFLEGSAVELSRVLEDVARTDRPRFAALVQRMEDDVNPAYFEAILRGLTRAKGQGKEDTERDKDQIESLETECLLQAIRRVHGLPNRPCGTEICRAIGEIADREISPDDLKIVGYYATEATDPENDAWRPREEGASPVHGGGPFGFGINTTRGAAAEAIMRLILEDRDRSQVFEPFLERMCDDPVLGVRCCLFNALLAYRNYDRDQAVVWFLRACEGGEPLFASQPYERFLHYAGHSDYGRLRPLLQCGLNAEDPDVVKVAARQTALAGLSEDEQLEEARRDAEKVRGGTDPMREAAAEVYARNIAKPVVGHRCRALLVRFFIDESAEVRSAAAWYSARLPSEIGKEYLDLITAYIDSPAFPNAHDMLLHRLENSPSALPGEVALKLADRFIQQVGDAAGDVATSAAGDAPAVAKLVFRQYARATDPETRRRCLDLIDRMERHQLYGVRQQLTEHDG